MAYDELHNEFHGVAYIDSTAELGNANVKEMGQEMQAHLDPVMNPKTVDGGPARIIQTEPTVADSAEGVHHSLSQAGQGIPIAVSNNDTFFGAVMQGVEEFRSYASPEPQPVIGGPLEGQDAAPLANQHNRDLTLTHDLNKGPSFS